jgi:hypothetical protein
MPSYAIIGNWLFLIGSLIFTFDTISNAWENCSARSFLLLAACGLFTSGCILFLAPAKADSQQ